MNDRRAFCDGIESRPKTSGSSVGEQRTLEPSGVDGVPTHFGGAPFTTTEIVARVSSESDGSGMVSMHQAQQKEIGTSFMNGTPTRAELAEAIMKLRSHLESRQKPTKT